ncbi:MAG: hypothetical protein CMB65_03095, partial [Euryarchaeota archaeon]|nr:hypothetical protein [Euryarchaeota archaeon]
MADVDDDKIEEIFNAELERLQAAMDELDEAPQEEPETIADAFEMATSEPEMRVPESSPMDTLLLSTPVPQTPPGPPSAPPMDAQPPGPPSSPSNKPAFAPPPGVFGGPPGAPPGPPPSLAAVPPGPPSAPPMDAQPPGPPASPPGPP